MKYTRSKTAKSAVCLHCASTIAGALMLSAVSVHGETSADYLAAAEDNPKLQAAAQSSTLAGEAVVSEHPTMKLKPYSAVYQAEIKGMKVRMKRSLSLDDQQLKVSMAAKKLIFSINEVSESVLTENGQLKSANYSHQRKNLGDRKDRQAVFDWQSNTVTDLLNTEQKPIAIEFPLYDKLNYQEQFRMDLIANPGQERFEYRISDGRGIKDYSFVLVGEETITTALGDLKCVKFKRDRGANSERQTYIWFAKDWDFLLARLDQIEGKDQKPERLELRDATIDGIAVTAL